MYRFIRNSVPPTSVTNRVLTNDLLLLVGHDAEELPIDEELAEEDGLIELDDELEDVPAAVVVLEEPPHPLTSSANSKAGTIRIRERMGVNLPDLRVMVVPGDWGVW